MHVFVSLPATASLDHPRESRVNEDCKNFICDVPFEATDCLVQGLVKARLIPFLWSEYDSTKAITEPSVILFMAGLGLAGKINAGSSDRS